MVGNAVRRRLAPIRVRTTIAATLVVGLAGILAGLVLIQLLRASMRSNLDALAGVRASDVAALVRTGRLRNPIATPFEDSSLVQVIDARGRVVAASANLEGQAPIVAPAALRTGPPTRTIGRLPIGDNQPFRLVVRRLSTRQGTVTILVATSLGPMDATSHRVALSLLAALPLLLGVVAGTTWVMTGRTLRPVEAIRERVAEVSTREMGRRVPVPSTSDEVERLARTMNSMLDRLEEARARERRFVADASHELRSPIAAARAQLETALAHPTDVEWPSIAATVLNEEVSMERLVSDLLLLARADHGALVAARTEVDLRHVLLEELDRVATRTGLSLDVSKLPDVRVLGDADQLARAIRNLVENAARHAVRSVSVALSTTGEVAELIIADDGPGIPRSERQRVFDRFTRLDEDRSRRSGGAGLGLSIANEIVEAHGGTVTVTDSQRGARILIRLPLAAGPTGRTSTSVWIMNADGSAQLD